MQPAVAAIIADIAEAWCKAMGSVVADLGRVVLQASLEEQLPLPSDALGTANHVTRPSMVNCTPEPSSRLFLPHYWSPQAKAFVPAPDA